MGGETLSIVSMNASRKGLHSLSTEARGSYLRNILEGAEPDICLLPGDDDALHKNVVVNYGQFMAPNNDKTVLLYDWNKIEMSQPKVSLNSVSGNLPGLDLSKIVCPYVEAKTLKPASQVVKRFSIITWKFDLFSNSSIAEQTLVESIITFGQRLAQVTSIPILIAGEMTIDLNSVDAIVRKLNKDEDQQFLQTAHPNLEEQHGFLPSMTSASQRPLRNLFKLQVFKCQQTVVKTWERSQGRETISDCFIASKELELSPASFVNLDKVSEKTGKQIRMDILKTYCPTKTEMVIPPRPPKHHGG